MSAGEGGPIHVTRPYLPPLDELVPYLQEIWKSRVLTNCGPMHQRLESELARHLGVEHVVLFNNGMHALVTALQAMDLKGEVITTPYSFVATAHAILWNDLVPVFVDASPADFNIDVSKIEAAITPRTCAILPVHCYGYPCDVERIEAIAREHGLKVVYDAAHAFGVRVRGESLLRCGDMSVLSFHATKVFNTLEGGAVVCGDPVMRQRLERLRNFGIIDEANIGLVGLNGKMNEVQAALGLLQLRHIDAAVAARREICERYRTMLAGIQGLEVPSSMPDVEWNCAYFPVLVRSRYPLSRDVLHLRLKERGVFARKYFHPLLSDLPMYRGLPSASRVGLQNAASLAEEVLCLPLYPGLSDGDLQRIVSVLRAP